MTALLLLGLVLTPPQPGTVIEDVYVEVDGRTVHALCTSGPREVVLLHDGGASVESWRQVLAVLDGQVGACAYDRTGSGGSDGAPSPRGWFELADELASIHRALGVQPSYVLVGHGLGGLYARLFAAYQPFQVGALVLVEPDHEDFVERMRRGMPADVWNEWNAERQRPNRDGLREADLDARARASTLPSVPVTVMTATLRPSGEGWNPRWLNEAARELHGNIIRRHRMGRHVPADNSSADIPRDAPRLIADEISRLVGLARRSAGR